MMRLLAIGCGQFSEWQRDKPGSAHLVRKSACLISAWTFIRHINRWKQWPFPLAITADSRRPAIEREEVARNFAACKKCKFCVDAGHGRRIQRHVRRAGWAWLMGERAQLIHKEFARMFDTQTDCRERKHAEHKRQLSSQTQLDHFVSRSFVMDSQMVTRQVRQAQSAQAIVPAPPALPAPAITRTPAFRSLTTWWHHKCVLRDKTLDLRPNPCTKEYWKSVKDELAQMPDDVKEQEVLAMEACWRQRYHEVSDELDDDNSVEALPDAASESDTRADTVGGILYDMLGPMYDAKAPCVGASCDRPQAISADALCAFKSSLTIIHHEPGKESKTQTNRDLSAAFRIHLDGFARDEGDVPYKFKEVPQCGPVCRKEKGRRKTYERLLSAINGIRAKFTPSQCRNLEVLISWTITDGSSEETNSKFAFVNDHFGPGVAGVMSASCIFQLAVCVRGGGANTPPPFAGVVLKFEQRHHVDMDL